MNKTTEAWDSEDPSGMSTREFRIQRNEARDVTGAIWLPEGEVPRAIICFGHGASGDRYQRPVSIIAKQVTEKNVAVLALDGPDHGLRQQDDGGRMGMVRDLSDEMALTRMTEDWTIALDWVREEYSLGELPLAYFGLSMGTAYGLGLVANQPRMKAAVLGLWGAMEMMPHNADFLASARSIEVPVLFLAQSDDEFVPLSGYTELFLALRSGNKRMHTNPGPHAQIPLDEVDYAIDFLLAHLDGSQERDVRPMLDIVDEAS